MKILLPIVGVVGLAGAAMAVGRRSVAWEVKKRSHLGTFELHAHDAKQHQHEHSHVTHNRRQGADMAVGEWEHLTATHMHEHNHPMVTHSHLPHVDADHEHLGEAHVHDHEHPTVS
jgi:hypothetical protein